MQQDGERTLDMISGRLSLVQHRRGYRFGLDALLLATDLPGMVAESKKRGPVRDVMELGAGQGAVALSIAARGEPVERVVCVERNPSMLELLSENVTRNEAAFGAVRVEVEAVDMREHRAHLSSHSVDLVVCNPPFFPIGSRRVSANQERADAHHELHGTAHDFLVVATYCLRHRGWLKMILPPWRLDAVVGSTLPGDLKLHTLRFVHASPVDPAYLVEIVCRRGSAPDLQINTPLFVRGADGRYSDEVARRVASAASPGGLVSEEAVEATRLASSQSGGADQ